MNQKICSQCRNLKLVTEFDHSRRSRDDHHHRCKSCDRKRDRQRVANRSFSNSSARWMARNAAAVVAHRLLRAAVRRGFLKRRPCQVCGGLGSHAHHEDYSAPLEVIWLCRWCHHERHRLERKYGRGQTAFNHLLQEALNEHP